MQKKNCVLCISIGIIVCILLSACSKQPDFDAKSYVQSSLDAYYHGEYKDYSEKFTAMKDWSIYLLIRIFHRK